MNQILVENLSFSYGSRAALSNVGFQVPESSIYGLLGPNGGGKTTLFKILSTLLRPTTGTAVVAGADVALDPIGVRRKVGVVFQTNSLDRELTVMENLRCQAGLYGLKRAEGVSRTTELLERFRLADRTHDLLGTLSGGLQRRVELAKSLIHHPLVLVLDEPTSALDPSARYEFWNYLRTLRDRRGMTILLTTHLMEEADRCDRLAILNHGRVVSEGAPDELRGRIGGDIVTIRSDHPESLARGIREQFELTTAVINGAVRIERPRGHEFVARVMEAFPALITAITVSRPTLEEVFVHETGHRFEAEGIVSDPELKNN
jgi:ABC-2 type transport system ATP-binding protein